MRRHGTHGRGVGGPCPGRGHRTAGRVSIEKMGRALPKHSTARDGRSRVCACSISAGCSPDRSTPALWPSTGEVCWSTRRGGNIALFVMDTSHGKRSACLELHDPDDAAVLRRLAAGADVFTQGCRAALARRGFGPEELAELRPGIIVVSINCYGDAGPWRLRPGWEQMAQTTSGMVTGQGGADHPELLPAAACDYTTGYLAALGTMAALWRRAHEGGSYHVAPRSARPPAGSPRHRPRRVSRPVSATSPRT